MIDLKLIENEINELNKQLWQKKNEYVKAKEKISKNSTVKNSAVAVVPIVAVCLLAIIAQTAPRVNVYTAISTAKNIPPKMS